MPARIPTPCRHRGCRALVSDRSGFCDEHKSESWERQRAGKTAHERGYGSSWRKLRALALRRDHGLCVLCLTDGRAEAATDVDHVLSKARGGRDELSNLQCLCRACHQSKTSMERSVK